MQKIPASEPGASRAPRGRPTWPIGGRGGPGRGRQRLGDLGKGGVAQDPAVEGDHHRELLGGCADLLQHPSAAAPDPSHITS